MPFPEQSAFSFPGKFYKTDTGLPIYTNLWYTIEHEDGKPAYARLCSTFFFPTALHGARQTHSGAVVPGSGGIP